MLIRSRPRRWFFTDSIAVWLASYLTLALRASAGSAAYVIRRAADLAVERGQLLFGQRLAGDERARRLAIGFGRPEAAARRLRAIGRHGGSHAERAHDKRIDPDIDQKGDEQRHDDRPLLAKNALEKGHRDFASRAPRASAAAGVAWREV
jgi:hypothetical protein